MLIIVAFFLFSTTHQNKNDVSHRKIHVVCTTSMIADTVQAIGGDCIKVKRLMGPGIDPHLYRARESDVHALASADIVFYNGLHLEGRMCDILHRMNNWATTVSVSDVLQPNDLLASDFEGLYDPHIWHDVQLWIQIVPRIAQVLIQKFPSCKSRFEKNCKNYTDRLSSLDTYVREHVAKIPKELRILVTAHDAFAYFGRSYGFQVVGLQGISTDSQIGTKDVKNLANFIVNHKIPAIFIESSIPLRNIQAVQKAVQSQGWEVAIGGELFSDALGDSNTSASTYIGMIKHNINEIVKALSLDARQPEK